MTKKSIDKNSDIKLIVFQKAGKESISYPFDVNTKLSEVRKVLESPEVDNFMKREDYFLNEGSKILISTESQIALSVLLNSGNVITVGVLDLSDPLDPEDGVQYYMDLSTTEKLSLFENVQIFNGLTFDPEKGFTKSFKKLYSWKEGKFPDALVPRVLTEVENKDAYSKVTHSLQETNTNSGSVSLASPTVGGEAEFKFEQSKNQSSSEVTQYITGKFLVRKVALQVDLENYVASDDFNEAIHKALLKYSDNDFKTCKAVVEVLNEYGYYIPKEYNLGGALFSSDSTTITEFSESETNRQEFGGSFKAAFTSIGGGASYNNASGSTQTTTQTDKFQITSLLQVGGRAGTSNDYSEWAKTLDKAIYWGVATFDEMLPSVAILSNISNMNRVIALFDKFSSYPGIVELQPHINLLDYATAIQNLYNPWGVR